MKGKKHKTLMRLLALAATLTWQSCREDEVVVPTEYDLIPEHAMVGQGEQGMDLLTEGSMGRKKCTLDYVEFVQHN